MAIAIPIFSSQLEKSRDATSIANLRSAYAQAQTEALTATRSTDANSTSDVRVTVTAASSTANTPARLSKVEVRNVQIKSQKDNNWSDQATELPFYNKLSSSSTALVEDTLNHLDNGQNGYVTVTFYYNSSGDLDIDYVTLSTMYVDAKTAAASAGDWG